MYLLKRKDIAEAMTAETFTFHYVSIKTVIVDYITGFNMIFTFHYVSIKTPLPFLLCLPCVDLHSTMYLLKQGHRTSLYTELENLHSTMYLLKLISESWLDFF